MNTPGRLLAALAVTFLLPIGGCRDQAAPSDGADDREQSPPAARPAEVDAPAAERAPVPEPQPGHRGLLLGVTDDPESPVRLLDAEGELPFGSFFALEQQGLVLLGRDNALRLEGGRFFSEGAEKYLASGLRRNVNQLTLAAWIDPAAARVDAEGVLIAYAPAEGGPHFALLQKGDALVFRVNAAAPRDVEAMKLTDDKPFHLLLSVGPDGFVVYRNGRKVSEHTSPPGHFADWKPGMLHFGNDPSGDHPWVGRLERAELHNVALAPADAKKLAEGVIEDIAARDQAPRLTFEGTLTARSKYARPWDPGFTYKLVLSVCEYKVDKIVAGEYEGDTIRVAEWMYVNRIFLDNSTKKIGSKHRLTVELLDDNPQLSTIQRDDTLDLDLDLDVYYNLGPLKALPPDQQPKKPESDE